MYGVIIDFEYFQSARYPKTKSKRIAMNIYSILEVDEECYLRKKALFLDNALYWMIYTRVNILEILLVPQYC